MQNGDYQYVTMEEKGIELLIERLFKSDMLGLPYSR